MRIKTVAGTRVETEPVRSTAYYYGDLEKIKSKNQKDNIQRSCDRDCLSEHLKFKEVRSDNLSLSEHKWRGEIKNESLSLSEHLKWREGPDIDPVISLTERLKWTNIDDERTKLSSDPMRWKEPFTRKPNEKLKRKNFLENHHHSINHDPNALSEYVESNEIINDGPVKEIPPFRDRKCSPEYNTPENSGRLPDFRSPDLSPDTSRRIAGETYSTAGTFPMPETKEKEPLLAELEVVGRVPLSQLDNHSGVRRSRSWYLCCPNVPEEDLSRESSWRYSSLRPVTVPPPPGQNGLRLASVSLSTDHPAESIRAERDALSRALTAERQKAAALARAHDARLAELHGVIAELVRRAQHKQSRAILEEEASDECESTTQPAGELDNDADQSRTEQNDTSSAVSPDDRQPDDDISSGQPRADNPRLEVESPSQPVTDQGDISLNLSDKDNELCVNTARCCQSARQTHSATSCEREHGSAEREHGSAEGIKLCPASPAGSRGVARQAKLASRVRLQRTEDRDVDDDSWCAAAAEKLSLEVCAQADYREALVSAGYDGANSGGSAAAWRVRCLRAQADCNVLRCALQRATDTAHKLSTACAQQESGCVMVCGALRAADAALECYDVLLALAETKGDTSQQRKAAEQVANQLLTRLETEATSIGQPLLSAGPWMEHDVQLSSSTDWCEKKEAALRSHAARLKADTVALRGVRPAPKLFSYHDCEDAEESCGASMVAMEAAVSLQEAMANREARLAQGDHKADSLRNGRRDRHWLDAASETDL